MIKTVIYKKYHNSMNRPLMQIELRETKSLKVLMEMSLENWPQI